MEWLSAHSKEILLLHGFGTFFMCGLCWFVQLIHYPLFKQINLNDLSNYEWQNLRTAIIAIPLMLLELVSGGILLWMSMNWIMVINMILFVLIGLSTAVFQAPYHLRLIHAPNPLLIDRLIQTNWIRTWAWTLRSVLVMYLMLLY